MTRKRYRKKKRPTALLDIIIPVMGQIEIFKKCLNSIPDAVGDNPYKVLVFDNGSPAKEKVEYKALGKELFGANFRVTESKENVGFPRACNRAVSRGYSPLIFLLNSDVVLDPGSVDLLIRAMDDPTIGIAGMKLLFPQDPIAEHRPPGMVQHVGIFANIRGEMVHTLVGWSSDNPKVNAIRDAYAVTGAALMTRRNLWKKAGGLVEEYGIGQYEDCDFSLTIRELGYNVIVETKAVGEHYTGATAIANNTAFPSQNRMIFLQRWGEKLIHTDWKIW